MMLLEQQLVLNVNQNDKKQYYQMEHQLFCREENAFDLLRNGSISVSSELIDLTLKSRDIIYLMLKGDDSEEVQNNATEILDGIKSLISGNGGSISKDNSSSSRASTSNTTINPVTETKSPKKVVIEKHQMH